MNHDLLTLNATLVGDSAVVPEKIVANIFISTENFHKIRFNSNFEFGKVSPASTDDLMTSIDEN